MRHALQVLHLLGEDSPGMVHIWTATMMASDVSSLIRDQEIWGMALWVEKQHGEIGWFHIAQQQDRLLEQADFGGVALWREVAKRFESLSSKAAVALPH